MKTVTTILTSLALTSGLAMADTKVFEGIISNAASIQRSADAISKDLKPKSADQNKLKADMEEMGKTIATLKHEVESFDVESLSGKQKTNWEMVKTKVQLIAMFHEQKTGMMEQDFDKNREAIRYHAVGIAKRAEILQKSVRMLDR